MRSLGPADRICIGVDLPEERAVRDGDALLQPGWSRWVCKKRRLRIDVRRTGVRVAAEASGVRRRAFPSVPPRACGRRLVVGDDETGVRQRSSAPTVRKYCVSESFGDGYANIAGTSPPSSAPM